MLDPNSVLTIYTVDQCGSSYPSAVTRASMTLSQTWDCGTGPTDPNSVRSARTLDKLGRVTGEQDATQTIVERHTSVTYNQVDSTADSALPLSMITHQDLATKDDGVLTTTTKTDQRGKLAWTQRPEGTVVQHLSALVDSATQATTHRWAG